MKVYKIYACSHCDFHSVSRQEVEDHELNCVGKKKPKEKKEQPMWKEDYQVYLSLVNEAKDKLKRDKETYDKFNKYHAGYDYLLSLDKTCEFWGSEDGWEFCKKKRKGVTLDMVAALKKGVDAKQNLCWMQKGVQPMIFESSDERKEGDLSDDGKKIWLSGSWCQL